MNRAEGRKKKQKERKKRQQATLEAEIFRIMEKSAQAAINKALDDVLKGWK